MIVQLAGLPLFRCRDDRYVSPPTLELVRVHPDHENDLLLSKVRVLVKDLALEHHVLGDLRKQEVAELVWVADERLNTAQTRGPIKLSLKLRQLRLLLSEKLNPGFGSLPLGRRSLRHGELARPGVAQCLASLVLVRVLRAHSSPTNRSARSD